MADSNKMSMTSALITSIVELSFTLAISLDQTTITTEHVLFSLCQASFIRRFLTTKGIDVHKMDDEVLQYIKNNTQFLQNQIPNADSHYMTGQLTSSVTKMIEVAQNIHKTENREIDIVDILFIIFDDKETYASYFMTKYGFTEDLLHELRKDISTMGDAIASSNGKKAKSMQNKSALETYCDNLNEKVKTTVIDPLIGREKEILTIAHTISKRKKCNVILVGDPGVGKSFIIEGLAQKINAGDVPSVLKDKIIFSLDVGRLMAGSKYRGDYEEKITDMLEELSTRPESVLFIDEAHQIDAGDGKGQMGLGLSSMIKPYLSRGKIKVIASTTWEGYRQTFERDTALMRRFKLVSVAEPTRDETIKILNGSKKATEDFHKVVIDESAIVSAVDLTIKYQPDKKLPDKAIDILDSACARIRINPELSNVVTKANIIQEITDSGITVKNETNDENDAAKILSIPERLKANVFHQDNAINVVSKSLIISQAGLRDPNKPIGTFLFVGPSGVGKTMLAQQLAADLSMPLLKYNMSEFQEKHSVSRLIGAPPGYIGFGDGKTGEGQLINDLLRNPNSVLLFDEIEKAHPDVMQVFLQLFEDGEITGTTGKKASSKNCIIILTSNLGTREDAKNSLGFVKEKTGKSESVKAVENHFLTEIRGRMTAIVPFTNLDEITYRRIVVEKINSLNNFISQKNVKLIASENLISYILELNKDTSKEYGARNISRIVGDLIKYPISVKLLNGTVKNNSNVLLDWFNNELIITQDKIKKKVNVKQKTLLGIENSKE